MNIHSAAAWVAVIGFLGGVLWIVFQYDQRIRTLETRVNLLLGTGSGGLSENDSLSDDDEVAGPSPSFQFNELCEALALRRADAIEAGRMVVDARELRELMLELRCITE